MLIANTCPYLVYFKHGYLRISINLYQKGTIYLNAESEDIYTHLTNNSIQKKHPSYKEEKEGLIWSMAQFEEYARKRGYDLESTYGAMKRILSYTFQSGANKLQRKKGYYELIGCDFILDQYLNPYLLELNSNPALFTDVDVLNQVITPMMNDVLEIVLD